MATPNPKSTVARNAVLGARLAAGLGAGFLFLLAAVMGLGVALQAQAPVASAAVPPKLGTVKGVSGTTLTVATDAGPTVTITVPDEAKVQQVAVGSTDIKTATPSQFSSIAVGDRVLASVKAGDTATSFVATRVVLIKSAEIAQMQAGQQADWKKNGLGGIVTAIDPATGVVTITSGAKKIVVDTSSKTEFKRFASDSVNYQDAKAGTIAQVQVGDQLQARGTKAADGLSVQAVEVVSGSFKDVSGVILSIDVASKTITLKDLATKKVMTVEVTANSNIRKMTPQMSAMFGARSGGGPGGGRGGGGGMAAGGDASAVGQGPAGQGPAGQGGGMRRAGGAAGGGAGADLAQMITRMPTGTLADLHKGDAVMIVASEPSPGSTNVTALTLLSGVESILTANPNGGMNLSMSMGGGGGGEE